MNRISQVMDSENLVSEPPLDRSDILTRVSFMNWDQRYIEDDTPWDKGSHAPILEWLLENKSVLFDNKKTAIAPGCGTGHDAFLLAQHGVPTVGFDISQTALDEAAKRYQHENLSWQVGDLFADLPSNHYDLIWEHTCYCAIHPSERDAYIEAMHNSLAHNGMLLGVFFLDTGRPDGEGPPYRTSLEELEDKFSSWFNLEWQLAPPVAYPGREDREHLMLWRRLPTCRDHCT